MAIKTYISRMSNFSTSGILFKTNFNNCGSYYITSSREEQKILESSPFFGKSFRLEVTEQTQTETTPTEKKDEKPANVFTTSSLQEARKIVMDERAKRNMPYKNFPNAKSVMKAAAELELEFPNIKVK